MAQDTDILLSVAADGVDRNVPRKTTSQGRDGPVPVARVYMPARES